MIAATALTRQWPARYLARLSQALTATDCSIDIWSDEFVMQHDISRWGHLFTDGVGSMSTAMARHLMRERDRQLRGLGRRRQDLGETWSAIQVRVAGCKGARQT